MERLTSVEWLRMKADGFYNVYEQERFTEAADEIERLREELEETRARMESNWSYHRFWEEKFSRHLEKIRQWEAEELERANTP